MVKRAILYARVSTDDQADKGYSLPSQLELCNKYAERLGYAVIAQLKEDYSGGTPINERPEGKRLAAMLSAREADAVIVYQVDRLSRDIVNLLATVQMWIHAGIEVHTCDIGRIESELDIVLVIKGWQGSDERKKFRERSMRGKRTKAQSGKVIACQPALGYRLVRDANGKAETLRLSKRKPKSFDSYSVGIPAALRAATCFPFGPLQPGSLPSGCLRRGSSKKAICLSRN
jgi:site-specific DNA recombinase